MRTGHQPDPASNAITMPPPPLPPLFFFFHLGVLNNNGKKEKQQNKPSGGGDVLPRYPPVCLHNFTQEKKVFLRFRKKNRKIRIFVDPRTVGLRLKNKKNL